MTKYTTDGYRILRDGSNVWVKGFCYSPVPIGASFDWEPFGDFFIPYWQSIYRRDLPLIQAAGANSLRLYTTKPYRIPDDPNSGTVDHSDFLDACETHGISVWAAYPINNTAFDNPDLMRVTEIGTKLMCQDMANHPAVMGFIIGNELNSKTNIANSAWWAWMNELGSIAKTAAPEKLTMQCFIDDRLEAPQKARSVGNGVPAIDVFGINSYRGTISAGFDILFDSYGDASDKPLLITEYGCPASSHQPNEAYPAGQPVELPGRAADQAKYIEVHHADMLKHDANHGAATGNVCVGGYVFEWCDEWWKQGPPVFEHRGTTARVGSFPGGWGDEEWYGVHSVAVDGRSAKQPVPDKPDKLTQRAAVKTLTSMWT
ncbi:MAG: hypothetical protein GY791_15905 [Alphaproteobacteria bacterium]|nr:hypothetical protein [Alphaproteobacteria bacterium]